LTISIAGKYAIRSMMHLASLPKGSIVSINQISKKWDIPEGYLRKIIPLLSRAGLIYSRRGSGGGIELIQSADSITFLDVIVAIEGKIFLNKCLINSEMCDKSPWCAANVVWGEAQAKMEHVLGSRTLADLVKMNNERYARFQDEIIDKTTN
jgi:Rrf2 family transcriptional regulator, cysteine metabolism repressor